jgi:hypothetical protein
MVAMIRQSHACELIRVHLAQLREVLLELVSKGL